MTNSSAIVEVRKLNPYERFLWLSGLRGSYCTAFVLRLKQKFSREVIKNAFSAFANSCPLVSACVQARGNDFFFKEERESDFSIIFSNTGGENTWEKIIEKRLNIPFKEGAHLIRVECIQGAEVTDLIVFAHHLLGDGVTCSMMAAALAHYLKYRTLPRDIVAQRTLDFDPIGQFLCRSLYEEKRDFGLLPNHNCSDALPCTYRYHIYSESATAHFINSAKENNTTVQGILLAAITYATRKYLDAHQLDDEAIKVDCPINLRPYLAEEGVAENELGCFFGLLPFKASRRSKQPFWELAKAFRNEIKRNLNKKIVSRTLSGILDIVQRSTGAGDIRKLRTCTEPYVGVSNLGVVPLEEYTDLVEDFVPIVNLDEAFYREDSVYVIASTVSERLRLSFVYPKIQHNYSDKSPASKIISGFLFTLNNIITNSKIESDDCING